MDWKCFLDRETEHNWEKRDLLMQTLSKHPIEIDRVQLDYVCSALQSLRTQLQFNALNAIESLIKSVPLDTYSEILLATLFKVISGSKKVILTPATNTAVLLMQNTQPTTRILAILSNMTQEKSVVVRTSSVLLLSHFYQNCLSNQWLTKSNSIDAFSKILERLLHDANPIVREQSRSLFLFFESNHPEQAHRLLGNVQDQIMKAIIKDRSKIAQSLLNKPIIPTASIASPKKVRSAAFINHVRNSSRDSMDSDVSANSMPSSYLSRPHTAKKDNDFFDNALDQINKTFGDISQSAIELPVLQDTADAMDIVINDGQIHKEVNDILTRSVDRFSVQDVNFLLTRIKKYKEWNVATCHALANKVITILTTSTQIDSKEDCFLLLQQVVLNLNEYLKGLELNLLTTSLLYINYDDDTVITIYLGYSCWVLYLYGNFRFFRSKLLDQASL